jgi:UDP-N-acetylglucosamine--N-acetylmuramyl-(pentapeptide) pyrophosphoryl-undecaprenol N-acetylglucosamine transferase
VTPPLASTPRPGEPPPPRIFLAGGGTGGHITPALATAAALRAARPDVEVEFVGTSGGMESRLVPAAGWRLHEVEARPLRRALSPDALRAVWAVWRAARRVRRLLEERNVVAACAFGGYTAGPLSLAARLAGVPLVLHEQNAVPGVANRAAARWAAAVAVSVEAAAARFPRTRRVVVTGNPVRPELAGANLAALRDEGRAAFDLEPGRRTLLVFGGSLGARRINDAVLGTAGRWAAPDRLQILHVAGTRDAERVALAWAGADTAGVRVACVPFVERMELAYAAADVVVCRAGASTVAELTLAGLPAVLVPYPHATADHQTANARALADEGAAVMIADGALDADALVAAAEPLLVDEARRAAAGAAARGLARPEAAARLAALVLHAAVDRLPPPGGPVRQDGR